jgi:hypothetical protein
MPANQFDLCAGGTVAYVNGQTSVTLTNNRPNSCNITGLSLPNASPTPNPGTPPYYTIPAKSGSTAGSLTITFNCVAGNYPYSSPCCDEMTPPVIIVQGAADTAMAATPIPICKGGSVKSSNGQAKIVLLNDHDHDCNVNLKLPHANPPGPYGVPKKSGTNPGHSKEITFSAKPGDRYEYTADCCGKSEGNPVIIVQ